MGWAAGPTLSAVGTTEPAASQCDAGRTTTRRTHVSAEPGDAFGRTAPRGHHHRGRPGRCSKPLPQSTPPRKVIVRSRGYCAFCRVPRSGYRNHSRSRWHFLVRPEAAQLRATSSPFMYGKREPLLPGRRFACAPDSGATSRGWLCFPQWRTAVLPVGPPSEERGWAPFPTMSRRRDATRRAPELERRGRR